MKQYINIGNISIALIFTLFTVAFLFNVAFVNAQENNNNGRVRAGDATSTAKERREAARENLAEKREARTERLNERAKSRISAYVKRITKRLDAALDRLERIADRVESRIAKLEEKFADRGLDLSDAKALLDVTRDEIASARENISSIESAAEEALDTDNPRESFTAVRELIKTAVGSVKDAHRALVEAIKVVKVGVSAETDTSTSTPENGDGE